jgi:hypothetical protein
MHRSTAIILPDIHPYEYVIVYISTFLNTAWQEHTTCFNLIQYLQGTIVWI